jgi:hypothetical protein
MLLVGFRRSNLGDPWGDLALLLVALAPCAFLYGVGFVGARATGETRPWQAVYLVFGTLLVPLVLFQFIELIDGDTEAPLNIAWFLLVTAVAGKVAALFAGERFGLLIAGLASIVAWLALWDEILSDGVFDDIGTLRGLLVLIGLLLAAGAVVMWWLDREGRMPFGVRSVPDSPRAGELVTAAGVAAVAAGAISIGAFPNAFFPLADDTTSLFGPPVEASLLWDLELLIASLALIGAGSWLGIRGPVYVGAIGLASFAHIVGSRGASAARTAVATAASAGQP